MYIHTDSLYLKNNKSENSNSEVTNTWKLYIGCIIDIQDYFQGEICENKRIRNIHIGTCVTVLNSSFSLVFLSVIR